MPTPRSLEQIETEARAVLEQRMGAVRELAKARAQTQQAQEAVTEAERRDAASYKAALDAGWTAEELRKVGLESLGSPARRTTGGRRRPRKAADSAAAGQATV